MVELSDIRTEVAQATVELVDISDRLKVFADYRYQRPLRGDKVKRIVDQFDANRLREIVLNLRGPDMTHAGSYAIIDGNHTIEALRMLGVTHMLCRVLHVPQRQEGIYFYHFNTQTQRTTWVQDHRARLEAGDSASRAVERAVGKAGNGFKVSKRSGGQPTTELRCVATLYRMVELYSEQPLTDALTFIGDHWAMDMDGINSGALVSGLATVFSAYPDLDRQRLAAALPFDPIQVVKQALLPGKGAVEKGSASRHMVVARYAAKRYNQGLRPGSQGWLNPSKLGVKTNA